MKPIKDYFKNKELKVEYINAYNVVINRELLLEIIKEIQIDTIKETVQTCADDAKLKYALYKYIPSKDIDEYTELCIDKSSILSIADKLIKELE